MEETKRKLHIMHVQESLEIGGMENGIVNLVNTMNTRIFKISICCINRVGALRERVKNVDIKVFNLAQPEGIAWALPFRLKKLFQEEKADIVHTHNFYSGFYGILGAALAGVPLIVHGEHGTLILEKRIRAVIMRLLSLFVARFLTVSEALKEDFHRMTGIIKEKIEAIINGVDTSKFGKKIAMEEKKRQLGIAKNIALVGSVGRLVPVKNYGLLIEAVYKLKRQGIACCLVIVGDGPSKQELENLAKELEVNAMFLGERNDVDEILPTLDCFVLASRSEGMSNTILEAMACGKPVVATDVGGNKELIDDGRTGFLVASGNAEALAASIRKLIEDKALAGRMGALARKKTEDKMSLTDMVRKYENIYLKLSKSKGLV